jgi:hypothetical protein
LSFSTVCVAKGYLATTMVEIPETYVIKKYYPLGSTTSNPLEVNFLEGAIVIRTDNS